MKVKQAHTLKTRSSFVVLLVLILGEDGSQTFCRSKKTKPILLAVTY